jgi:hypothetical protein
VKSVPVVSPNFLERIAQPTSQFHSDYLAYKRGRITRAGLIARLPHIAMIGDSVCMDFHISSAASTFWRARTCRGKNWFLDVDPTSGIQSVSKQLEELTPFVAIDYAGVGAMVDDERQREKFFGESSALTIFPDRSNTYSRRGDFPISFCSRSGTIMSIGRGIVRLTNWSGRITGYRSKANIFETTSRDS